MSSRRSMTPDERRELEKQRARLPSSGRRVRQALENVLVLWAAFSFAGVALWALAAWISRRAFHIEFGLSSPAALYFFGVIVAVAVLGATISTVREMRGWKDYRPLLQTDLDATDVIEERHEFVAAKSYQEQEHGGIIWCLRTSDDRIYAWYDYESVDLQAEEAGKDGADNLFKPTTELRIVRGVASQSIVSEAFSGVVLPVESESDLMIDPRYWPEDREYFTAARWDALDDYFLHHGQRR